VEKYFTAGHATGGNMTHARCILDTQGYKHKLTICNTYRFSTATVVARTYLNITSFVHCWSCLFWSTKCVDL